MVDISSKEFSIPPTPDEGKAAINKVLEVALLKARGDKMGFRPGLVNALNKIQETGDFTRGDGFDGAVEANGVLAVAKALTSDKQESFYIGTPSPWTIADIIKLVGEDPQQIPSKTRKIITVDDFKGKDFANETVYRLSNGINLVKLADIGKAVGGVSLYAEKPEVSAPVSQAV